MKERHPPKIDLKREESGCKERRQRVRFHQTHTMLVYRVRVVWFSAAILNQLHDVDVYQAEYWLTTSINTKKGKIACHLFFTWREAGFGSIVASCLSFFSVFFCGGFIHPRTRDLRVGAPNFLHLCSAIANSYLFCTSSPRSCWAAATIKYKGQTCQRGLVWLLWRTEISERIFLWHREATALLS